MKHVIKKQKTAVDNTRGKSSITPREIEKEKDICSEVSHNRNQKFSEIGIRNYWRRNGFRKRVLSFCSIMSLLTVSKAFAKSK